MKDFIKNNYNRTLVKLIVLTTLVSSCGLDTCLYTTECKSTSVEGLACTNLGDTTIQRYTEEAMNDLESENYNHAIGLLDCLINNNNSDDKSYARRGLAYIGRTNRYAPTTLLLNLADPTYLTNLQTELTTIEPATSSEVDTLYQVGEDLIRGASDILTASSISDNPSTFQTLKWLSLLYNGIGSAYIFRSHRFFSTPNHLDSGVVAKIEENRAGEIYDYIDQVYQTSLRYSTDSDSVAAGLATVSGAILVGLDYPQYALQVAVKGETQGLIDFLEQ